MILPTKNISEEHSLLFVGARVLSLLSEPKTVSRVWDEFSRSQNQSVDQARVPFDWFVLSLDLLFLMGALVLHKGRLERTSP